MAKMTKTTKITSQGSFPLFSILQGNVVPTVINNQNVQNVQNDQNNQNE